MEFQDFLSKIGVVLKSDYDDAIQCIFNQGHEIAALKKKVKEREAAYEELNSAYDHLLWDFDVLQAEDNIRKGLL